MDLLGAAASLPQVLQPGAAFHDPLALLDGHVASCAQNHPADRDKDKPLLPQHLPSAPDPGPASTGPLTDWPPNWHTRQDCPVGGTTHAAAVAAATSAPPAALFPALLPDVFDLAMAREPQLPAAPVLQGPTAEDFSCNILEVPAANGPTARLQPPSDQEMTDADRSGGEETPGSRKRSAAEMLSSSGSLGADSCGEGPCIAGAGQGSLPSSTCHSCHAAGGGEDQPAATNARDNDGSAAANPVGGAAQPRAADGAGEAPDPGSAATEGAAAEPSASPPDPNASAADLGNTATTAAGAAQTSTSPSEAAAAAATAADSDAAAPAVGVATAGAVAGMSSAAAAAGGGGGAAGMEAAAPVPDAAVSAAATDRLAMELRKIMARCGGVSDPQHAGRLTALVEGEERLGGRLTLLTVLQQSSQEVLRLFVQGSGLRSLERWVVQFRDEGRHPVLVTVIGCLKMLPIDLTALKGSSIGQTVGKLRKHTNPAVRNAASELVDLWKSVVDKSVGKGAEARGAGAKSKAEAPAQDGPNKRPRKQQPAEAMVAGAAAGSSKYAADGSASTTATSTSGGGSSSGKVAVMMDDDLFVPGSGSAAGPAGGLGSGGPSSQHPLGPHHRPLGLTSFISGVKKVHAVKLENMVPSRAAVFGGSAGHGSAAAGTGAGAAPGAPGEVTGEDGAGAGSCALPSPTPPRGDGAAAGSEATVGDAAAGPSSPKPGGDAAAAPAPAGGVPSLLPLAGAGDGASSSSAATSPAAGAVPKTMVLPRLGTLAGPNNPTVRLGSLRDGSLPTSGIARLGAASGMGAGGRVGTAASLPAAVAPGGPQSAHARAMAARARAPSPEPAPRKEKKKTVSWAGDDALASYRLFKKDDPPQAAASDAVLTAEDEAAAADSGGGPGGYGGGAGGGMLPPPGFQSAARREHASERMALIAQHQQEEAERQQEMERWAAMRPTVPWVEPPELYLGAVSPQQLPALGEESGEREAQARARMHVPKVVYYSPTQIPFSPGEPPPEPEPDLYRVRHIPLHIPGGGSQMAAGAGGQGPPGQGPGPQQPSQGMLQSVVYGGGPPPPPPAHPSMGMPLSYGGQLPLGQGAPPPPQAPGPPQPGAPPVQPAAAAPLSLHPEIMASLQVITSTLAQQAPGGVQQQPGGPGQGQGPPGAPGAPGQQQQQPPPPPPPPQGVLPPPPHPLGLPQHPHARGPHAGPGSQPQPGLVGAQGGPPMQFGMQPPPHAGMGPGPGPSGMPPGPGPGRPGGRFEPGPGMAPGLGPGAGQGAGAPPPPPPRKDGQPTLMRPRRADEPPPLGPPQHPHPHPHMMNPGRGGRPAPHGMAAPGGGPGPGPGGPGPGGWAASPATGGPGGGPSAGPGMGGPPPPPGAHVPGINKMCVYFNTPAGCRNGDNCRFLHVHSHDAGQPYDNGPYAGPGRGGLGMGRPGGGPPPGMPGGMRRR